MCPPLPSGTSPAGIHPGSSSRHTAWAFLPLLHHSGPAFRTRLKSQSQSLYMNEGEMEGQVQSHFIDEDTTAQRG